MIARKSLWLLAFIAAGLMSSSFLQGHAQSRTFGIELGTGRIICTDDADYSPDEDDPSYAASAAWDAAVFGDAGIPCFAPLTELDPGVWLQSEPFDGADDEGRRADFRIYVLHDTYNWKIGSTWQIEHNGVEAKPESIFQAPNFKEKFCGANAAFAFGASSHEGPRLPNERTAGARATTISNSLREVREVCTAGRIPIIFGVNLGEHSYDPSCPTKTCSANQRRVIIISADEITIGVDLADALAKGIEEQRVFEGLQVENYSLFDISSH